MAASRTARLIAACVCPVVGAGTLTMAVPKVRNAVHKATAPREYALPKTRERMPAGQVSIATEPCVVGGTGIATGFTEDLAEYATGPTGFPVGRLPTGGSILPINSSGGGSSTGGSSGGIPGGSSGGGGPGAVPEPHSWLQLLVGFTLIGGSVRLARRRATQEDEELLARAEVLKKDVLR